MRYFKYIFGRKEYWLPPSIAVVFLSLVASYDFLTFHVLAEGSVIIIGFMMFAAAWNTARYTQDYFILFMGTGYFWVAVLDIFHVMAYPGMNLILPGSTNLATQFWFGGLCFNLCCDVGLLSDDLC